MRRFFKAAIIAFGVAGALAASPAGAQPYDDEQGGYDPSYGQAYGDQAYGNQDYGPGYDQPYDQSYDPGAGYYGPDYGYCDPGYDCPDDFYDLPLYYGDVYYGNTWYNGPFYWRDYGGRRQYWVHGGWRYGNNRGGHFGPALGRNFYRSHGFNSRSFTSGGNWGGQNYARRAYNPQQFGGSNWNNRSGFGFQGNQNFQTQRFNQNNHNWNRGSFSGGGWNRQGFQGGQNFQSRSFQNNGGGGWQGRSQAQIQQAPAQQNFGGHNGGGWRGGDHGGGHGGWGHNR